jgi:hypothetical protein
MDLANLFWIYTGSLSLTVAIFYVFFVKAHNKNMEHTLSIVKTINVLYAEVTDHNSHIREIKERIKDLEANVGVMKLTDTQHEMALQELTRLITKKDV